MVTTYLKGGLGNYMFQMAAALAYGLDHEEEVIFLDKGLVVHKAVDSYKDTMFRNINFVKHYEQLKNRYTEPEFSYNKIPYMEDLSLVGYFQSEKYFKHHRREILSTFSPNYDELGLIHDRYGYLTSTENSCSIHVRRGDYLKVKEHHPPCTMEYYKAAMSKMPSDVNYLVFSDDIGWCKENFIGDEFTFIEGETDTMDMHLMSYCKHNIIANSSFSWWGAWLNNNNNKIVTIPSQWFGPAKGNTPTKDIYSEGWIKI